MESGFKKIACEVLGITQRSYSNYSKQNRPIMKLLEKYFNKDELEEFLNTGRISKYEILNTILEKKKEEVNEYLEYFQYESISNYDNSVKYVFFETLSNYYQGKDFYSDFTLNKNLKSQEELKTIYVSNMVKKNLFNILDSLIDILIETNLLILIEKMLENKTESIDKYKIKLNEAIYQCTMFNVFKHKKNLSNEEKEKIALEINKKFDLENTKTIYPPKQKNSEELKSSKFYDINAKTTVKPRPDFDFEKYKTEIEKLINNSDYEKVKEKMANIESLNLQEQTNLIKQLSTQDLEIYQFGISSGGEYMKPLKGILPLINEELKKR